MSREFLKRDLPLVIGATALHVIALLYYFPLDVIFGSEPVSCYDYGSHFYTISSHVELLRSSFALDGYDPFFLAGYRFGGFWSIGAIGSALFVYAMNALGASLVFAFHFHLLLLFAALPAAMYVAARLFDMTRIEAMTTAVLSSLVWYLDPCVRWEWLVGMFSFASASYMAVLMAGLLYRYMKRGGGAYIVLFGALAVFASLLHPVSGVALILPAATIILLFRNNLDRARIVGIGACSIVLVVSSIWWVMPLLESRSELLDHAVILQGGLGDFVGDMFGWRHRVSGSPFETIFSLRRTMYIAAIVGTIGQMKSDRRKGLVFVAATAPLLVIAYLGSASEFVANLQPYRFLVPLIFFAALPAAAALATLYRIVSDSRPFIKGAIAVTIAVFCAALFFDFRLTNPELFAGGERISKDVGKLHPASPEAATISDWLRRNGSSDGRVFLDNWAISTAVQRETGREIVGGPHFHVPLKSAFANLDGQTIFGRDLFSFTEEELAQMFDAFNIQYAIALYPDIQELFDSMPNLLARAGYVKLTGIDILMRPGYRGRAPITGYVIYKTNIEPGWMFAGSGSVKAELNKITIYSPSPGDIVLKYHFIDGLKTNPPVAIKRIEAFGDPAGFIQLTNTTDADKIEITR